jgi:D-beta-D-heptose 7-phosphate kinase/D-beta-D-heptose 1-phosphate adenosyltransferase
MLRKIKVRSHILKLNNYPTIVKTRVIANNNHLLRIDQEKLMPFDESLLPKFERIVRAAVKWSDIILLSDYNKGCLIPVVTKMIIRVSRSLNKPIIVDPKGNNYEKYSYATLVKPNLKEFNEVCGQKLTPVNDGFYSEVTDCAKSLFSKYHIENLLVTLSERGMMHLSSNDPENYVQIAATAKEVFDVSGAGDTVIATLGAALGCGMTIQESMKLANIAAGIVLAKLGTATATAEELKTAVDEQLTSSKSCDNKRSKIVSLEQAKDVVCELHRANKKIGFTNGCFDCCHFGHLSSLMQAKRLCDVLIVAVNSDSSVKRYKGADRPIQDERTRSTLLASLEFVDYVIVFEEDSPIHIVEALHPDIVAKEGYTLDKWPEGRCVINYGGRAVTLERENGYSTSELVKKMRE